MAVSPVFTLHRRVILRQIIYFFGCLWNQVPFLTVTKVKHFQLCSDFKTNIFKIYL